MHLPQITTERTYMRQLTPDDAASFYLLNQDPEVLKFTGDVPFESINAARDFLTQYDQYEKYGVGRLAVIEKSSETFIGWCGLKYNPDKSEYDIGFRFFKTHWNKGFATETAKSCLEFGVTELGITQIVGRAMQANKASISVLEKIGMTFKDSFEFDGEDGVIYEYRIA